MSRAIVDSLQEGNVLQGRQSQESGVWLATTPPTVKQRRLTLAIMILLFLIFLAAIFASNVQLAQSNGFIPFVQATMFVTELLTAALLYTQFAVLRSRAILLLASGYLFTSLFVLAHTLAFPNAFSPDGLLGGSLQTPAWLHLIWHFAFPASVAGYAWIKGTAADSWPPTQTSAKSVILWGVAIMAGLTVAIIAGLIAGDTHLPPLLLDKSTFSPLAVPTGVFDTLVCVFAFGLLWRRQSSVLDRWLLVAIFAAILEMAMLFVVQVRFTSGWYSMRLFGVTASGIVLVAFLAEATVLYARLANANALLRRERANRLMSLDAATSAMAHELRQPLTAIRSLSGAGLLWLKKNPPNIEEARDCITSIDNSVGRADEIISSVRELFKHQTDHRANIHIDDVAKQVLELMRQDLQANSVSVSTEFQDNVPEVHADRTQMQQVILNLLRNAIDAMHATTGHARHLRMATRLNGHSSVVLSIQDSGHGIAAEDKDRVFDSFFTTKSSGMGLGLPICQTIVEDHGGELRIARTDSEGSVFEVVLPIANGRPEGAGAAVSTSTHA